MLVLLFSICFAGVTKAQSIRWADTDKEFVRKIGDNLYEPVPAGFTSYKIEKEKFWMLCNGEPDESGKPKGHLSRKGGKTYYYNRKNEMVGYYVPATNRYYTVSVLEGGAIGKEDEFAVLFEGNLYIGLGELKYKVDSSFSPEILGFFLFLH